MPWRYRIIPTPGPTGDYFDSRFGNTVHDEIIVGQGYVDQSTYSENHDWPRGAGMGANIGGPFFTNKSEYIPAFGNSSWGPISGQYYTGPVTLGLLGLGNPLTGAEHGPSSDEELMEKGATALKAMDPTKSVGEFSTMLGELRRDGLPSIPGSSLTRERGKAFKDLGSEYLNVEFGWVPFVSEIRSLAYAAKHDNEIIERFRRESGRNLRRSYDFPTETTTQEIDVGSFYASPLASAFWQVISRPTRALETISRRQWVRAAFTYETDAGDTLLAKAKRFAREADKLYGTDLTPETVWELAPWSWAADWFGNTGDVVANISSKLAYGSVIRYAYIMEEVISHRSYVADGFVDTGGATHSLSARFKRTVKTRLPASPFGFGLHESELDAQQWAILGALGISRSPGSWRY